MFNKYLLGRLFNPAANQAGINAMQNIKSCPNPISGISIKIALLTLSLITLHCNGQICNGSVGDAIVDITFGSGSNPGPPLAPGITNMLYVNNNCPDDGQYTICTETSGCYGAWIHCYDHTGNPNGYFMLINASYQPNQFFVDTITDLCEGVSYQFAAWIINMFGVTTNNPIEPNLTFTIQSESGLILQSDNTGPIPESGILNGPGQWQQYKFDFTTPQATSNVVLIISNNAPGGYGNDLGLDDITFRPIGPNISVSFQGYQGDTVIFCGNAPPLTLLSVVDSCYSTTNYQWQQSTDNGTTWTDINGATAKTYVAGIAGLGTYLYRLAVSSGANISNTNCRIESSPLTVIVYPAVTVLVNPKDTTVCPGSTVTYTASGGTGYQWANNTGGVQNTVTVGNNAQYIVTVTTNNGCYETDTAFASVYPPPPIMVTQQNTQRCDYDSVILQASGGISYNWSNGSTGALTVTYPVAGDSYTVTVTDSLGCTASSVFYVQANTTWQDQPVLMNPPCAGKNFGTISLSVSGNNGGYRYVWTNNDTTAYIDSLAPGNYGVTVTDAKGCDTSYNFILQYANFAVTATPADTTLPDNVPLTLQAIALADDSISYSWTPANNLSCTACPNPLAYGLFQPCTYTVCIADKYGCTSCDSVDINTINISPLYIPTAFTPNGDGTNDFFKIYGPGTTSVYMPVFQLKIFDRWGEKVYETDNPAFEWDGSYKGKMLPPGVYVYELSYFLDGAAQGQKRQGSVTLLR